MHLDRNRNLLPKLREYSHQPVHSKPIQPHPPDAGEIGCRNPSQRLCFANGQLALIEHLDNARGQNGPELL
jgi:hypothetical protein